MKKLIINADDFGFCPLVNQGILHALKDQLISDFSFMIKQETFKDSLDDLKRLGISACGLHLNLTSGTSVHTGQSHTGLIDLVKAVYLSRKARKQVENEIEFQLHLLLESGITITHVDSHQNFHLLPFLFRFTVKTMRRLGVSAPLRVPAEWPKEITQSNILRMAGLNLLSGLNLNASVRRKVQVVGQNYYNNSLRDAVLDSIIGEISKGKRPFYEFPLHPGYCNGNCGNICRDSYTGERAGELDTLVRNRGFFTGRGIDVVSFADILGSTN